MKQIEKKIIGFRAVLDALPKGNVVSIKIDPSKKNHGKIKQILEYGVKVSWQRTEFGIEAMVLAEANDFKYLLKKIQQKEKSTVVILDCLQDTGNFGAIIRSADAFDVDLIIIPNKRSVKLTDDVIKISAGSAANVPIVEVANLAYAIEELKKIGFWVYGSDMLGSEVRQFDKKTCLIMGNESEGLRHLTKELCDFLVKIPMSSIDSLNVSHACSILLCDIFRS